MKLNSPKKMFSLAAVFTVLGGVGTAHADTPVSWANTNSAGNWSDPTQWNPQVSPNGAYAVTLPAGSETVTVDISPIIDSLNVGTGVTVNTAQGISLTTGSLANSGNTIFASGNQYIGYVTVTGSVTNSNAISVGENEFMSVAGNVTNNGGFATGYAGGTNQVSVSGTFTNNDDLQLASLDTVNLNALSNSGLITVNATSKLNVGSGTFSGGNGYQQLGNGVFDEVIGGSNIYGLSNISGPVALDGTLDVTLDNGFIPTLGESFAFLDGTPGELSGAYANIVGQPFVGGQWQVTEDEASGYVTLTAAVPEPASLSILALTAPALFSRRRSRQK